MSVIYNLIGGDSKPDPSIDDIFAVLTSNLYLIKSCNIKSVNELKISTNPNIIRNQIFRFRDEALIYVDTSLHSIADIKSLGDKVANKIARNAIEELDDISEEQYRSNSMTMITSMLENTESELMSIKQELQERSALLTTSGKDKLKLDMSVDEIATLFRGLEKAGIIIIGKNVSISTFVAQNFSAKKVDSISSKSISNKMSEHTEGTINSVLSILDKVANEVKKLKAK